MRRLPCLQPTLLLLLRTPRPPCSCGCLLGGWAINTQPNPRPSSPPDPVPCPVLLNGLPPRRLTRSRLHALPRLLLLPPPDPVVTHDTPPPRAPAVAYNFTRTRLPSPPPLALVTCCNSLFCFSASCPQAAAGGATSPRCDPPRARARATLMCTPPSTAPSLLLPVPCIDRSLSCPPPLRTQPFFSFLTCKPHELTGASAVRRQQGIATGRTWRTAVAAAAPPAAAAGGSGRRRRRWRSVTIASAGSPAVLASSGSRQTPRAVETRGASGSLAASGRHGRPARSRLASHAGVVGGEGAALRAGTACGLLGQPAGRVRRSPAGKLTGEAGVGAQVGGPPAAWRGGEVEEQARRGPPGSGQARQAVAGGR